MTVQKLLTYTPLDITGQKLSSTHQLNLNVLENSGNYLIQKDIIRHYASQRQGTVSTKTRSEVRGGGRKPWKQKGTGRARAGSNRSPLWKGGGVIFGPKPKKVISKLNKKERRLALQTLLYNKKNSVLVIDNLENEVNLPKTKIFIKICQDCGINLDEKLLIIVSEKTKLLKLSTQNIKNVELISASSLNTLSLMKAKQIILTPLAVNDIKEIFLTNSLNFYRSNAQIIKYPIITDKATRLLETNQYSFIVDRYSDKITIKAAIEYLFNVKVVKINTCNLPRKKKRVGKYIGWKPQYKKAIVTLSEGDVINLFTDN